MLRFSGGRLSSFFATLEAGETGRGELVLELLDASGSINELEFASEKRMARAANINFQLRHSAARCERIATAALHRGDHVVGMNVFFHITNPSNFFFYHDTRAIPFISCRVGLELQLRES